MTQVRVWRRPLGSQDAWKVCADGPPWFTDGLRAYQRPDFEYFEMSCEDGGKLPEQP